MRMETVLLIGGAAIGVYFWNKSTAAGRLNFFPGPVVGIGLDGATPVAQVQVLVQNTSNTNLTLNSFAGNVFSDGTLIGNISSFQPQVIQNNSQVPIAVNIRFAILGVVNEIMQAFQTNSFSKDLTVAGTVNADGVQVPIQLKFKIGG